MVIDFNRQNIDLNYKPRFFVYDMIETLLPRSKYTSQYGIKRLELYFTLLSSSWGDNTPRQGWIKVIQQSSINVSYGLQLKPPDNEKEKLIPEAT